MNIMYMYIDFFWYNSLDIFINQTSTVHSTVVISNIFRQAKLMQREPGVWPWHPPMHPSLPLAPGWCEVGSGEPPSIALGRHAETNQHLTLTEGLSEKLEECFTALTLIHGWFMNSVMVILCVGSVLRRVLISSLAVKTIII